jgi:murein L,D-transpeptidase YcbB/YkuD
MLWSGTRLGSAQGAPPPSERETLEPVFAPATLARTAEALEVYRAIAARGLWTPLPAAARALPATARDPVAGLLKARLAQLGDLPEALFGEPDAVDAATAAALRRFQYRHGLSETGVMGPLTFQALNVSPARRVQALEATLARLRPLDGALLPRRHVIVNLPGASLEAILDGRVERRHTAVVGRRDRPSPTLTSRLTAVNLNPTWTIPRTIALADIIPRWRRDPQFLARSRMRFITFTGPGAAQEIDPALADVFGGPVSDWWIRQDPGPWNALGQIRFDMPNAHDVFMHDTPQRNLFRNDVRFNSSGCARIADVRDFAVWLLQPMAIDRRRLDREIATNERRDIRLSEPVPVAWVYLTAWGASDGTIQFREDIYGLDTPVGIVASTVSFPGSRPRPAAQPAAAQPAAAPPADRVN